MIAIYAHSPNGASLSNFGFRLGLYSWPLFAERFGGWTGGRWICLFFLSLGSVSTLRERTWDRSTCCRGSEDAVHTISFAGSSELISTRLRPSALAW